MLPARFFLVEHLYQSVDVVSPAALPGTPRSPGAAEDRSPGGAKHAAALRTQAANVVKGSLLFGPRKNIPKNMYCRTRFFFFGGGGGIHDSSELLYHVRMVHLWFNMAQLDVAFGVILILLKV